MQCSFIGYLSTFPAVAVALLGSWQDSAVAGYALAVVVVDMPVPFVALVAVVVHCPMT